MVFHARPHPVWSHTAHSTFSYIIINRAANRQQIEHACGILKHMIVASSTTNVTLSLLEAEKKKWNDCTIKSPSRPTHAALSIYHHYYCRLIDNSSSVS